jgi:hypothetical protein
VHNVSWQVIEVIELTPPVIDLLYPGDGFNLSSFNVSAFNYTVNDTSSIANCSLFGNWSNGWHRNQSVQNPFRGENNFSSINVENDGYYIWNVECADVYGNVGINSTNFSFGAFLFPGKVNLFNISQSVNDGTGNVTLFWSASAHSTKYRVYYASQLSEAFSLLGETTYLNFTDANFSGNRRRFYRIDAWNPVGQNSSSEYFGAHVYTLGHNGNTRNMIGFPSNASYLTNANETLNEIRNATAVTMWNASLQKRVTCNRFSCPVFPSCTESNCNFNLEVGAGYEVNLNSSAPSLVNWSLIGVVYEPVTLSLIKNSTDFGKNWISIYGNTTLVGASDLLVNISNSDAVSYWDYEAQTSRGLIPNPFPFGPAYLGDNFSISVETGYEVSVTQNVDWTQI